MLDSLHYGALFVGDIPDPIRFTRRDQDMLFRELIRNHVRSQPHLPLNMTVLAEEGKHMEILF